MLKKQPVQCILEVVYRSRTWIKFYRYWLFSTLFYLIGFRAWTRFRFCVTTCTSTSSPTTTAMHARRVWQLIQCCPTGPVRSIRSSIKLRLLRCLSPSLPSSFISFLFLESRGTLIILSLSLVVPRIYHTNNLTTRIFKLTVHCYLLSRS